MRHYFSDGLLGLAVLGKRLTGSDVLLASHYLGFGTLPGAGEHRQRVRCTSQIRGMVRIGRDRGQHRPQLLCGTRQVGLADLLAHTGHHTPRFSLRLGSSASERTLGGLETARARGRKGGRKPKLSERQVAMGRQMHASGEHTVSAIADTFSVTRPTIHKWP